MTNPIIEEVREARAALAAEHGYDRQGIYEWARKAHAARQKASHCWRTGKKGKSTGVLHMKRQLYIFGKITKRFTRLIG